MKRAVEHWETESNVACLLSCCFLSLLSIAEDTSFVTLHHLRLAVFPWHNTVKHAHPRQLVLRLAQTADGVTLEVRDNGAGFDPNVSFPGHLGLQSMHERIRKISGMYTYYCRVVIANISGPVSTMRGATARVTIWWKAMP